MISGTLSHALLSHHALLSALTRTSSHTRTALLTPRRSHSNPAPIRSRAKLRSTPHRKRNNSNPASIRSCLDPHFDPLHSDPLQSTPIRISTHTPIHSDPVRSTSIHSDPSSDSVDAHGEFSEHVSHSDLIFLRSIFSFSGFDVFPFLADNPISPIHKSSLPFSLRPTVMLRNYFFFFFIYKFSVNMTVKCGINLLYFFLSLVDCGIFISLIMSIGCS